MSTRANVRITDGDTTLWFYRHSDGYPDCTGESLKDFVRGYKKGYFRDNPIQSAGHLVLHGNKEYRDKGLLLTDLYVWKCGAYEPTDQQHSDIEFLYTIDLAKRELICTDMFEGTDTVLADW